MAAETCIIGNAGLRECCKIISSDAVAGNTPATPAGVPAKLVYGNVANI